MENLVCYFGGQVLGIKGLKACPALPFKRDAHGIESSNTAPDTKEGQKHGPNNT